MYLLVLAFLVQKLVKKIEPKWYLSKNQQLGFSSKIEVPQLGSTQLERLTKGGFFSERADAFVISSNRQT